VGLDIGFVLTGHQYRLARNRSHDHTYAGYLITGSFNQISENEALRNGRVGLYLASQVPLIAGDRALLFLRQSAGGNWLQKNTALGSGQFDVAEFEQACDENTWTPDNIYETSHLAGPCPPEEEPEGRTR
jgi:hypothetical protein